CAPPCPNLLLKTPLHTRRGRRLNADHGSLPIVLGRAIAAENRVLVVEENIVAIFLEDDFKRYRRRAVRTTQKAAYIPPFHHQLPVRRISCHGPENVLRS